MRPLVVAAVQERGLRPVAREIGVSYMAVSNFLKGATPHEAILDRYEEWAKEQGGEVGDGIAPVAGRNEEAKPPGVDEWYASELARISALGEPEWLKTIYRDSATAAFRAIAAERTREAAEHAAAARASALRDASRVTPVATFTPSVPPGGEGDRMVG